MAERRGSHIIRSWPEQSREAAGLVIEAYGEPHEATSSLLTWHGVGPWKRVEASREYCEHLFPSPHVDSVETFIDYRVPPEKATALARFDGSVIVERTAGEVSVRCHDERANVLALNLMHDIVTDRRTVQEARDRYGREFADQRRGKPTPYMDRLRFRPGRGTSDPDTRTLYGDQDLGPAAGDGDVIDELTADHREVDDLFARLDPLPAGDPRRRELVDELTVEMVRHAVAEELHVFPAVREHLAGGHNLADKELLDHAKLEELLKDLEGRDMDDTRFDTLLARLRSEFTAHVRDEEGRLFRLLAAACSPATLDELGEKVRRAKRTGPTRPHPTAPHTPPANRLLAPGIGLVDRARDLLTGRHH